MKSRLAAAVLLCLPGYTYASCGSSYCTVNTHWDLQGPFHREGLRIDLRYSYAKADVARVGSSKVVNDPALATPGDEVENQRTINQTLNLDINYAINTILNITFGLPIVKRDHAHTIAPGEVEQGQFTKIGDVRVVANYNFDTSEHHSGSGVSLGLKLPTGSTSWEFLPGVIGERSLQPGSGSTDAILGVYHHQDIPNSPWGWFANAQIQTAFQTHDDYRPGNDFTLDFGTRYAATSSLAGLLQLNVQIRESDSGRNANPHSGGKSLNLSPGINYAASSDTRLYSFIQLPLYQYASADPGGSPYGQLTSPWSVTLGISHRY